MALELSTETVTVAFVERTYRIEIVTPAGGDPEIRVYRERVRIRDDGEVLARDIEIPPVVRRLSEVATQSFVLADPTIGGLAVAIADLADQWSQENVT